MYTYVPQCRVTIISSLHRSPLMHLASAYIHDQPRIISIAVKLQQPIVKITQAQHQKWAFLVCIRLISCADYTQLHCCVRFVYNFLGLCLFHAQVVCLCYNVVYCSRISSFVQYVCSTHCSFSIVFCSIIVLCSFLIPTVYIKLSTTGILAASALKYQGFLLKTKTFQTQQHSNLVILLAIRSAYMRLLLLA